MVKHGWGVEDQSCDAILLRAICDELDFNNFGAEYNGIFQSARNSARTSMYDFLACESVSNSRNCVARQFRRDSSVPLLR